MAGITFVEAARVKMLWIAAIAGAAFVGLFWAGLHSLLQGISPKAPPVNRQEGIGMMTMMALYAGTMMTSLMSALISCDTISGEVASGTIHAIATKPVNRWCLVLGKWIGFVGMLTMYVVFIEGGTMTAGWIEARHVTPHIGVALSLIWLQAVLLISVTIAFSTRLSALTSGACTLGLYGLAFVGGWIEQFGAIRHVRACVNLGILASTGDAKRCALAQGGLQVQPPLLGAAGVSPFSSSTIPSPAMVVYAALYAILALVLAQIIFERRDL
jgi:ABC-type transport system involved in multi-copper enzyme maturation permease subunit